MAKHDKVQLKREELIGNDVVLEDINPKSNTASIINDADGTDLNETINRIWNAINDQLSRIVNSVNGRTGAVVINSSDVGLGRVDNVSFADIQDWVLNRLEIEFANKRLHLFDSLDDVESVVLSNDAAYKNTPFYAKTGWSSNPHTGLPNYLSHIGYFYWDTGTDHLAYNSKAINVIGATDNSIIYNDSGVDGMYGKLRVNIWNDPTNALEIKNPDAAKNNSGLWVNPAKVNAAVFFYKGCYGVNGDRTDPEDDAFLELDGQLPTDPTHEVDITIDGTLLTGTTFYLNETSFKIGDIIICQFSDEGYRTYDSTNETYNLKTGVNRNFVNTQPKIGQVTDIYDPDDPDNHPKFKITFTSMRPTVDTGLRYYNNNDIIGAKPVTARINNEEVVSNTNMSGINVLGALNENKREFIANEFNTVTPVGPTKTVYKNYDVDQVVNGADDGIAIVPDMSLNVIPSKNFGKGDAGLLPNWPLKTAGDVDDRTDINEPEKDITYLGVNLDKLLSFKTTETVGSDTFTVRRGFYSNADSLMYIDEAKTRKVVDPTETERFLDFSTNLVYICTRSESGTEGQPDYVEPTYELYSGKHAADFIDPTGTSINASGLKINMPTDRPSTGTFAAHSGGLAVNTGNFLEVGDLGSTSDFYNNGKVNVRIDETQGLHQSSDETGPTNKIGVHIDEDSGLSFNNNGSLRNNVGIGARISEFDTSGTASVTFKHIVPSINDIDQDVVESVGDISTDDPSYFGGLRYLHGDGYSTIGARINDWSPDYGEPIKHGSEGLKITADNVLGVQPYTGSPIVIKHLEDYVEEHRSWVAILPMPTIIFTEAAETLDPRVAITNAYLGDATTTGLGEKVKKSERSYVVKGRNREFIKRYVYVGNSSSVSFPSVDDYEPQFEYFATLQDLYDKFSDVRYERLNSEPVDWSVNWTRYFRKNASDQYVPVTDAQAPQFYADVYFQRLMYDANGHQPNRDKVYIVGTYGLIRFFKWGPRKTIYYPDVDKSPHAYTDDTDNESNIDTISAVDATKVLIEIADISGGGPSTLTDEQKLRANFNSTDNKITSVDASYILTLYADIASTATETYTVVSARPDNWYKSFTNMSEIPPIVNEGTNRAGMCYAVMYPTNPNDQYHSYDPATDTPVPVYYVKRRADGVFVSIIDAYGTEFANHETPDFYDIDDSTYDGHVYALTYGVSMDWIRNRFVEQGVPIHDPHMVDDFVEILSDQTLGYNTSNTRILKFESGVSINVSENRGLCLSEPDASSPSSDVGGIAVKIFDKSTGSDDNSANTTRGAIRYCNDGGLAVRINDTNTYNPSTGRGSDDLSEGTHGLKITNENVLGIKIRPNALDGLSYDANGNLVMIGLIAAPRPATWSTTYTKYWRLKPFIDDRVLSDSELEYKMYHRTINDFEKLALLQEAPEWENDKYYINLFDIYNP